jgi:hypothetical protein
LATSFWSSTQTPPQRRRPGAQPQTPATHASPAAHARPHAPQLEALVCRFAQPWPQTELPGLQQ